MKKLLLSVMLVAFAVAVNAGAAKDAEKASCPAKKADAKAQCCPMTGKQAKGQCPACKGAPAPKVASPKGAEQTKS